MVSPPGTSSGAAPLGQEDTWNQGFEISYPKTSMATCFPQRQWGPQGATTVFHPFSRLQSPPPHIAISLGSPGAGMGASDRQALGPPPSSLCQLEQNLFCWIQRNPPPNLDGVGEPSGSKPALFLPCQTGREHAIPSALLLTR